MDDLPPWAYLLIGGGLAWWWFHHRQQQQVSLPMPAATTGWMAPPPVGTAPSAVPSCPPGHYWQAYRGGGGNCVPIPASWDPNFFKGRPS